MKSFLAHASLQCLWTIHQAFSLWKNPTRSTFISSWRSKELPIIIDRSVPCLMPTNDVLDVLELSPFKRYSYTAFVIAVHLLFMDLLEQGVPCWNSDLAILVIYHPWIYWWSQVEIHSNNHIIYYYSVLGKVILVKWGTYDIKGFISAVQITSFSGYKEYFSFETDIDISSIVPKVTTIFTFINAIITNISQQKPIYSNINPGNRL